jgi:hypothetical protein
MADNGVFMGAKISDRANNVPRSTKNVKRKADTELVELARKLKAARKDERNIRDTLNPVVRKVRSMTSDVIAQMKIGGREIFACGEVVVTLKEERMSAPTTTEIRDNLMTIGGMTEEMVEQVMSLLRTTSRTVYRVGVSDEADGDDDVDNGDA